MHLLRAFIRPAPLAVAGAFVAGTVLRFLRLSSAPPSLYCDEAFQGYEAWSLLLTGADSRGVSWPLFFDIFGMGWQEPLYVYLTMIPVKLLGTTPAAPRVVAAVAGSLSILAVAWLAHRAGGRVAAATAALTMAVSPWAFHFSRVGFQASLLPLFIAAGVAALLKGAEPGGGKGPEQAGPGTGWIAAGLLLLSTALYTYVAARGVVPLLLIGFGILFLRPLLALRPAAKLLSAALVILPVLPLALFALSPEGMERFQDVGLASQGGVSAAGQFVSHYLGYFSPGFLLTDGDPNLRHSVAGFGMLHPHGVALLVLGAGAAVVRRKGSDLLLLWWLATAPLGAAMTADPTHAVRAIGALPAIHALAGVGAAALFAAGRALDPKRLGGAVVLALLLAGGLASSAAYFNHYFGDYPVYSAPVWQFGLLEAYTRAEARGPEHDSIYVTRAEDFPWIHRLYLFGFPPADYQRERFEGTPYLFDEPVFYRGGLVPGRERPLYILKPFELEASGLEAGEWIRNPDGTAAFVLAW